jgi:hypothetical protein
MRDSNPRGLAPNPAFPNPQTEVQMPPQVFIYACETTCGRSRMPIDGTTETKTETGGGPTSRSCS